MAAAMVRPGTQVVSISGDGGFLFSAQELETATRLGLSFTHVIMRDNSYDMVAFQEVLKYGRTSGVKLGDCYITQYDHPVRRRLRRQRNPNHQHRRVRERIQAITER